MGRKSRIFGNCVRAYGRNDMKGANGLRMASELGDWISHTTLHGYHSMHFSENILITGTTPAI